MATAKEELNIENLAKAIRGIQRKSGVHLHGIQPKTLMVSPIMLEAARKVLSKGEPWAHDTEVDFGDK